MNELLKGTHTALNDVNIINELEFNCRRFQIS